MVMCCYTLIASFTVLSPQWLFKVTDCAILALNKHDYVIIIIPVWAVRLHFIFAPCLINRVHLFHLFGRANVAHFTVLLLTDIVVCVLNIYTWKITGARDWFRSSSVSTTLLMSSVITSSPITLLLLILSGLLELERRHWIISRLQHDHIIIHVG